jgi:hypothetical protein
MASRGRLATAPIRSRITGAAFRALALVLAANALASCAGSMDALMVDPAQYDGYHCKDLIDQWNGLVVREKNLRNLINRADESGTGMVIGALAYRSDYQTVLAQEKLLQRTAAGLKCELVAKTPPPQKYKSDQVIR